MIRPLTPEVRAAALTLYSWSLIALLTVMLGANPHSASRETRGTANMLIRNTLMARERTGRLHAIAPHNKQLKEARRDDASSHPAEQLHSGFSWHPHHLTTA